jgi:O-antigen ligase
MFLDASPLEQLFGVGWGNLSGRIWAYLPAGYPLVGTGVTENSFLFLTFGGGIAAGLSYVVFCGAIIARLWHLSREAQSQADRDYARFAIAMAAMMLVQGMTGDLVLSPVLIWYYYAIIGIGLATIGLGPNAAPARVSAGAAEPSAHGT